MKQFPIQFQKWDTTYYTPSIPNSDAFECRGHKNHGHYTCGNFTFT